MYAIGRGDVPGRNSGDRLRALSRILDTFDGRPREAPQRKTGGDDGPIAFHFEPVKPVTLDD